MSQATNKTKPTISFSQVNKKGQEKELTVPFGDAELLLTYSRAEYTPQVEEEMTDMANAGRPAAGISTMLIRVLRGWNLTDDNGAPAPLTAETLAQALSVDALMAIVTALGDDQRPKSPTAEPSTDF